MHYTKLFSSIIHSTIWREPDHVRLVWITMLAMKERDGTVQASLPGLADAARVTLPECQEAIKRLEGPDEFSRNPEHDGRRIEKCPGGWILLNAGYYVKKLSEDDRREYRRKWAQENRNKNKAKDAAVHKREQMSTPSTHLDLDLDLKEKNLKKDSKRKSTWPANFELTEKRKMKAEVYWQKKKVTRDVGVTWDKFAAHHQSKGTLFLDWDKAWETWYVNAIDMGKNPAQQAKFEKDPYADHGMVF